MENYNTENTTVENSNVQKNTTPEIHSTNNESKGGDKSRTSTAILLLASLIPVTILVSIMKVQLGDNTQALGFIARIIAYAYQIGVGIFLIVGLNEAMNFIAPKEENLRKSNIIYFPLLIMGVGTFVMFSIDMFAGASGIFGNWRLWLLFMTIIYLVTTSISPIDFKDVLVALFMTVAFTLFVCAFSWTVMVGGWQIVVLVLGIAIMADTFAYTGGKKYGKRKAFPEVSPNKTIEGVIIGFFAAIAFGWIFWLLFIQMASAVDNNLFLGAVNTQNWAMLLIIAIAAAISPFGDLTFSKIKRSYGKKDFSNLLPGHGGIFDRLDSHIFVTIITVLLITQVL